MTMTDSNDRYTLYFYWVGQCGHGGHRVFLTHAYARAGEHTPSQLIHLSINLLHTHKYTMTTMTSMTIVVIARATAVILSGHSNFCTMTA